MGHCPIKLDLPEAPPERWRAAVRAVLAEQTGTVSPTALPQTLRPRRTPSIRFREGAEETVKESPSDRQAAEDFQSLLELGYLVASADGLSDEEQDVLADLVADATGHAFGHEDLRRHFTVLDAAREALGRHERIGRVASNFEEVAAREEALSFASLIAIADRHLGLPELRALLELGERLGFTDQKVEEVLDDVVASVRQALEAERTEP